MLMLLNLKQPLKEGDKVIVSGIQMLADKMPVKPLN